MPERPLKKHSSIWVQVKISDNKFKLVTCKEQEVCCVAGMRGENHMLFPGLTKEECPLPTLVVEIKGLGLGQDLKPNNNVIGYFIFSQKKRMLMLVV